MDLILKIKHLRKHVPRRLSKQHLVGVILGGISALAADNILVFGFWIFGNLHAPVGFYPFAAVSVYTILLPFWRWNKRRKKEPIKEGKWFKFLEGIAWGSAAVGFATHIIEVNLGIEIPPTILRPPYD
jgi:hypothetical protein